MEDKEILEKLERILRDQLELDETTEITLDTNFRKELGVDSLDEYELLYEVEDEFNISLPEYDERVTEIRTMRDIADYLKQNYKL